MPRQQDFMPGGKVAPVSPGGLNTQVQVNDNGTFNGDPAFTFDKTPDALHCVSIMPVSTKGGDYVSALDIEPTWNPATSGGDYRAININLTDNEASNQNAVTGINMYMECDGSGVPSFAYGMKLETVTKASKVIYGTHGYIHSVYGASPTLVGHHVDIAPGAHNSVVSESGMEVALRGSFGGSVNGAVGVQSGLDAGPNTTIEDFKAFGAVFEISGGTTCVKWTGLEIPDQLNHGGAAYKECVGIQIGDLVAAENSCAIKTGLGRVQFGDKVTCASLNLPVGPVPTSPADGDIWREDNTDTGLKIRVNGVTKTITLT